MTSETVEGFRLSPQQHRLWLLQERDGTAPYRTRMAIRVEGALDADRLRRALDSVVARHEILRTTFPRLAGMGTPLQVVNDRTMVIFDLSESGGGTLPEDETRFDLSNGPVASVALRRSSSREATILLDFPAVSADRATLERLLVELDAAYRDDAPAGSGPPQPLQYADVAEWWNELVASPESAPGIEFWRRLDVAAAGSQELPLEKPGDAPTRFHPKRIETRLSRETLARMEELSGELDVTPETFLLACWQVLLQRLTGDSPVIVGYATPGRRLEELKTAMGPFARLLPLRVSLEDGPTFQEALRRVRDQVKAQERWEDLFTWRSSGPSAEGGIGPPSFAFAFEYASALPVRIGGASGRVVETRECFDRFKARLSCVGSEDGLTLNVDYDAGRLEEEDARALAERFRRTVESAVGAIETPIARLEILPETERRRLREWNDTSRRVSGDRPIHERFEQAAARTPEAVAVVCDGRRLTYADLNERANRMAHLLRDAGVARESRVALCVERSVEMIVGILAIWKAGGGYVPLDPALPDERLAFLLEDAGASLVVTRSSLAPRFASRSLRALLLDEPVDAPGENPSPAATPESLAYVIYTSGSTGRPKGVAVEHRQIANYVDGILQRLDPPAGAAFATVTTPAADLGNTSIFAALASGGRLHVITEQSASDPEGLAEEFENDPVDYLKIVPSHLAALLSASRPERILPRRCLVLGGEPSSWELIERVRSLAPHCDVVNHYGPTEATIGVTTFPVPVSLPEPRPRGVPVGRPLPNCRVFILDGEDRPVPIGVAGELHVGGAGLSRGYLNRAELTAEKFPEIPIDGQPERLYRTGDLARFLRDGNLELLGRTDDQIKLHGFRIEPGEIQSALREHPAVAEAIVLPRDLRADGKRLVAYVVARGTDMPASADLRRFLLGKLPEFMLPAAFVRLPRIPLTPNGKIDRAALPLPDPSRPDGGEPMVEPRTEKEKVLAKVWRDVLRVERFGVHDNFFELGGDSILAIQIIARAAREGLRLTPRQLFERQTVAELAAAAESGARGGGDQGVVAGPVPLTPIQHWFFEQELRDPHHYNQAMLLESREPLDADALEKSLGELVRHHDALRLRFSREGETWLQVNAGLGEDRVLSVVRLGGLGDSEREEAVRREIAATQASLDLSRGPIVRAVLFEAGSAIPSRLLLVIHHLAVDGVSWRILLEDLERSYRMAREGRPAELSPKTTSFRDWARALVELGSSDVLEPEVPFWRSVARESPAALPIDGEGENTIASARIVASALSEEETRALLAEVPAVYRTQINDILLTALAQAFHRWTGSSSLLLDLEGHGREELVPGIDLSRSVGWFTARFPVLLRLPEEGGPGDALVAVKEQLRAVPERGIGYGILRYLSNGARDLKTSPEPAVTFNYLGQLDQLLPADSLFRVLSSPGGTRSRRDRRRHPVAVEGKVVGGALRLAWIYSENLHRRETIALLAEEFAASLRALIAHCRSAEKVSYSPADFPQARLSQKDLDKLLKGLKTAETEARR